MPSKLACINLKDDHDLIEYWSNIKVFASDICWTIVIRNGIFAWHRNWDGHTGNTSSKHQEMAAFGEEFLTENDFEAVLATFCCCEHGYACCYDLLKRQNQYLFLAIC